MRLCVYVYIFFMLIHRHESLYFFGCCITKLKVLINTYHNLLSPKAWMILISRYSSSSCIHVQDSPGIHDWFQSPISLTQTNNLAWALITDFAWCCAFIKPSLNSALNYNIGANYLHCECLEDQTARNFRHVACLSEFNV